MSQLPVQSQSWPTVKHKTAPRFKHTESIVGETPDKSTLTSGDEFAYCNCHVPGGTAVLLRNQGAVSLQNSETVRFTLRERSAAEHAGTVSLFWSLLRIGRQPDHEH